MLTNKQKWRRIKSNNKINEIQIEQSKIIKTNKIIFEKNNEVCFSQKARLILIPTRQDYKNYGLHNELWWQPTDYLHFKSEAKEEVTILMKLNNMDVKSAIHHLYQPHNHNNNNNPQNDNQNQKSQNNQLELQNLKLNLNNIHNNSENNHCKDGHEKLIESPRDVTRTTSPPLQTTTTRATEKEEQLNSESKSSFSFQINHSQISYDSIYCCLCLTSPKPDCIKSRKSKQPIHPLALMV